MGKKGKNGSPYWKWACTKCGKSKKTARNKNHEFPPSSPKCCSVDMKPKRSVDIRGVILKAMGYSSYKAYLGSDLWMSIRKRVLAQRPNCEMCGNQARCVHHRSYEKKVLLGEMDSSLTSLCMSCHEKIEFSADGEKRHHYRANYFLNRVKGDIARGEDQQVDSPSGVVNFGKHKGSRWSEVPDHWLIWCRTNIKSSEIRSLVRQEIGARALARAGGKSSAPCSRQKQSRDALPKLCDPDIDDEFRQILNSN